jgi:hypothetical protein
VRGGGGSAFLTSASHANFCSGTWPNCDPHVKPVENSGAGAAGKGKGDFILQRQIGAEREVILRARARLSRLCVSHALPCAVLKYKWGN